MASNADKWLKKGGYISILLGVAAIAACEFPVMMALLGMGTLYLSTPKQFLWIEIVGSLAAVSGSIMLIVLAIRHWRGHGKRGIE